MSNHARTMPTKRRKYVAATAVVGVLAAAAGAFAYWTGGGSGSGSAATADNVSPLVVNQTTQVTDLAPGSGTVTLAGTFDNDNSGPVRIGSVTVTGVDVTKADGVVGTCGDSDYTVGGTATVDAEVPVGDDQGTWSGLTIAFNNKGTNQDACKGATLAINYAAS